jgi:uncharacterized protein (UPF0261 family)
MAVLLIGTLDTKGTEIAFVRDQLREAGLQVLVADASVLGPPAFPPDIAREQFYAAAGFHVEELKKAADRGQAIEAAAKGAAAIARDLHQRGQVDGILGLGGSAGTTIATAAMRALPFGVPKLMVSTLASGQVRHYVGVRDVMMLNSVVDISGLNRISRIVLTNAAQAMIGMVRRVGDASPQVSTEKVVVTRLGKPIAELVSQAPPVTVDKPLITATMFGVTTPCVEASRKLVEAAGYEVLVFHATGVGGMTMESFIADGLIRGVLDLTTTELADEMVGGVLSAGPDRLTAAALHGIAQVISLGALDMVNFGPPETVPTQFRDRRFYQHNPTVTLMRTTPREMDQLGKEIAHKASAAKGPTAVLVPLRGVSAIDAGGKPFWWPEADQALFQSIRNWISPDVKLIELDLHINDPAFAEAASRTLLDLVAR